jgi:hypothetical protein
MMKWIGLMLLGGATLVLAGWLHTRSTAAESTTKPPPLKIDRGAPLLLDKPAEPAKKSEQRADNQACHVCHGKYDEEPFAKWHAEAGIGCTKCHGPSLAHSGDEDNITPPDRMYAPADIAKCCEECHDTHDAPADKVIACWQEKCPARTDPKQLLCTDCHGEHRLTFRTVWWDRETRKLGERKPGEKFRFNPDLKAVPAAAGDGEIK